MRNELFVRRVQIVQDGKIASDYSVDMGGRSYDNLGQAYREGERAEKFIPTTKRPPVEQAKVKVSFHIPSLSKMTEKKLVDRAATAPKKVTVGLDHSDEVKPNKCSIYAEEKKEEVKEMQIDKEAMEKALNEYKEPESQTREEMTYTFNDVSEIFMADQSNWVIGDKIVINEENVNDPEDPYIYIYEIKGLPLADDDTLEDKLLLIDKNFEYENEISDSANEEESNQESQEEIFDAF